MGAGIHKYSQVPEAWLPEETLDTSGAITADPFVLFDAACKKFRDLWKASDAAAAPRDEGLPDICDSEGLPDLTADDLETAANTFRLGTSSTYDGIHPRQLGLVSRPGLDVLAELLNTIEDLGAWPPGIQAVVTASIPKPKGGMRTEDHRG